MTAHDALYLAASFIILGSIFMLWRWDKAEWKRETRAAREEEQSHE